MSGLWFEGVREQSTRIPGIMDEFMSLFLELLPQHKTFYTATYFRALLAFRMLIRLPVMSSA
jgi:hypothetical protein